MEEYHKNVSAQSGEKIAYRPPVITVLLILACFLYLTFTWSHFWNTNEYSRVFLTRALIDHQSFSIDQIVVTHDTQDKSLFQGKYYSNKAPLSSFMAAPVYLSIRLIELFGRLEFLEAVEVYLIASITLGIPSALFLFIIFKFWLSVTLHYPLRRAILIAYAIGTMVWPYSSMYYGHVLAGMSLFLAFLIVFNVGKVTAGRKTFFECGFFCGLAFALEYPAALIALCIFLYTAVVGKKLRAAIYQLIAAVFIVVLWIQVDRIEAIIAPHVLDLFEPHGFVLVVAIIVTAVVALAAFFRAPKNILFFIGAALPVGVTLYYHLKCFGGLFEFPYYHETYRQFAVAHQFGIAGVTFPASLSALRGHLFALLQLLISPYRGLFLYSPFLLLGIGGIVKMIRDQEWRREGWLILAITVVYFFFLSAFSDWEGGWSMGPRHLVPILPFLTTAVVFYLGKTTGSFRKVLIWFLAVTSLIAIFLTFVGTVVFPYLPKEFKNPLYDLSWQFLTMGKFAPTIGEFCGLTGFYRLLPLIILVGALIVILLRDLSREISRKSSVRIFFIFGVLGLAGVLLLAGLLGSRYRTGALSNHQSSLQNTQKLRIEAFMKR
ncbi:MAG: hypothetical protein U9N73_10625 [Candidatus Auribacterota bacterium]|nr:hypothetical protein [Candidatus Auribacterota bacterium]